MGIFVVLATSPSLAEPTGTPDKIWETRDALLSGTQQMSESQFQTIVYMATHPMSGCRVWPNGATGTPSGWDPLHDRINGNDLAAVSVDCDNNPDYVRVTIQFQYYSDEIDDWADITEAPATRTCTSEPFLPRTVNCSLHYNYDPGPCNPADPEQRIPWAGTWHRASFTVDYPAGAPVVYSAPFGGPVFVLLPCP